MGANGFGIGEGMPSAIGDGAPAYLVGGSVRTLAGRALAPVLRVGGSGAVSVAVAAVTMRAIGNLFAGGTLASGRVIGVHGSWTVYRGAG